MTVATNAEPQQNSEEACTPDCLYCYGPETDQSLVQVRTSKVSGA